MKHLKVTLIFLSCLPLWAQLSPGKLAEVHGHISGLTNCSSCHTIGSASFKEKCLACHTTLAARINEGKGLHANEEHQTCRSCHSDHQGAGYAMIHWPDGEAAFDHAETGYALTDKHATASCRDCHQEKHMAEPLQLKGLGKNTGSTFLGLSEDCRSCHEDVHDGELGQSCGDCHTSKEWAPAPNFDHNSAAFVLKGAHAKADCASCHPQETGQAQHRSFKPLAHEACVDCHKDLHGGNLGNNCESCHNLNTFKPATLFDHDTSAFPLTGLHRKAQDCEACHPALKREMVPTTFSRSNFGDCESCHRDPHEKQFKQSCASCHSTKGWHKYTAAFRHEDTRFPLLGKHEKVACDTCHRDGLKRPDFETCISCHKDPHQGQFKESHQDDCGACHDNNSFQPSLFTVARHQKTVFPLEQAHLATPCFACHAAPEKGLPDPYRFDDGCVGCHEDVHGGEATAFMTSAGDCAACHEVSNWQTLRFDHEKTSFPLLGAHAEASCGRCHGAKSDNASPRLTGLGKTCGSCHEDVHLGQFRKGREQADCGSCHGPTSWAPTENFDHNQSRFSMEGAHAGLACKTCHPSALIAGKAAIRYKPLDPSCASCHLSMKPSTL